jgi:4-aminobutyrate aminotransferase-like enzyme
VNSRQILGLLREYESRNVTFVEPDGSWPIVWKRARGVYAWDADGRKYLDLTAAFGVAAAGHGNPRVVAAGQRQMAVLLHAMGDVHPHALKAQLARELSRITFERWAADGCESRVRGSKSKKLATRNPQPATRNPQPTTRNPKRETAKTIFCNSGFEAVEAALKTALLSTGKPGVIAFEGAYHGVGYGALNATHREHFRRPFLSQLREFGHFVPFPKAGQASRRSSGSDQPATGPALEQVETRIRRILRRHEIGAVLVEPIQVRGGVNIPPPEFLPRLRRICREHKALLIVDEIYTGFGRTGKWFACEHPAVEPDILCLGKALTGGFPLSACVGRAEVMDEAWPASSGEAIHTSTFLGHPVGCTMALAQIEEIRRLNLVERSAELGGVLLKLLHSEISDLKPEMTARGLGLLAGLELRLPDGAPAGAETMRVIKAMLHRGFILLPEGEHANVISFTPPLTITKAQLKRTVQVLADVLNANG